MGWNEPDKSGRDPWGGGSRKSGEGPPDLEELLRRLKARFGGGGKGKGVPSAIVALVIALIVALWFMSGFYVVDEQERAVVLRFGAYTRTSEPGLRWHLPWPIEDEEKVKVTQIRQVTDRADMLTVDENIVDVELKVQYRVSSVEDYLFRVKDPDGTLRQATKSAVREVVGRNPMDFIITEGRQQIALETKRLLQDRLDEYQTGLVVVEVNLQQAKPPEAVQEAFNDAIKAREDHERLKNEAQAYANDRLPRARGAAARQITEATAYRDRLVAEAEGESARFTQLLGEYRKAPRVTRERLYLETMAEVLSGSSKVMIDVDKSSPMFYLPLDQLLKNPPIAPSTGSESPSTGTAAPRSQPPTGDFRSRDRGAR